MGVYTIHHRTGDGPVPMPEERLFCAHCRSVCLKGEMIVETNPDSPVYGALSCDRPGCWEGPGHPGYLRIPADMSDDVGPDPTSGQNGVNYNS